MKPGEMLSKMLVLAVNSHDGQFDKSERPYILHPLYVMGQLPADDEELQCIGLGHDLVEDCKVTFLQLRELDFTPRVINGIRALTRVPGQTEEEYEKQVIEGGYDSMIVKCKDLEHNSDITRLKGIRPKDFERTARYQKMYLTLTGMMKEAMVKAF